MVARHYLKHAFDESDESVLERFLENPYWQYFGGFEYFQHELPLDPTSLVKWRKRVGSAGTEKVFNNPVERDGERWVAFPHPQVIFQYFNGLTGELAYSETITTSMK